MSIDEKRYDNEKVIAKEASFDNADDLGNDELREPTKAEETLHRGLKARQISMIAVSPSLSLSRMCSSSLCSWEVQSVLALSSARVQL